MKLIKNSLIILVVLLSCVSSIKLYACWATVPLKVKLSRADLVVTATVTETALSSGTARYCSLKITQVLKNDLVKPRIKIGDNIKLYLPMATRRSSLYFSFKKGEPGLWMLNFKGDRFYADWPGVKVSINQQQAAEKLLKMIKQEYKTALQSTIPQQQKYLADILRLPLFTKRQALSYLNKPIPKNIDPESLYTLTNEIIQEQGTLLIGSDGKFITAIPYFSASSFHDDFMIVSKFSQPNKRYYLNSDGSLLLDKIFHQAGDFSEGLARVAVISSKDKFFHYGYINRKGKMVIPAKYDYAADFSGGVALVRNRANATTLLINKQGKIIFKGKYLGSSHNGLTLIELPDRTKCFINQYGKIILSDRNKNYQFGYNSSFSDERCAVKQLGGDRYGFINLNGKLVIPQRYSYVGNFSDGLAAFNIADRQNSLTWGFINKQGEIVIKPQFSQVKQFSNGVAVVAELAWIKRPWIDKKSGRTKFMSTAEKYILAERFALINRQGKRLTPPIFTSIECFTKPLSRATIILNRKNIFSGLINCNGKVILVTTKQ